LKSSFRTTNPALDTKTRMVLILAALIGSQATNEYKIMMGASLNV
jgi:4-carboxymuconolactone decarboxylase